jgi:hypothetical protein
MINSCRRNKNTIMGGFLNQGGSSIPLYTITESQYLETINNDDDSSSSSSCNSTIRTTSFADDEDDSDDDYNDDNDDNDENENDVDDEDTTLRTSSRWDTDSSSNSSSGNNIKSELLELQHQHCKRMSRRDVDNNVRIDCPPTRPIRSNSRACCIRTLKITMHCILL